MKTCTSCKTIKPLSEYHKHSKGKFGRASRCKGCISAINKIPINRKAMAAVSRKWRQNNPTRCWVSTALSHAKQRAKERSIAYSLTHSYVLSILPTHCPVFGTAFIFRGNVVLNDLSPSIDRIDPKKGYVEGNVAIISIKANRIKSAYSSADLLKVARWLKKIEHDKT